MSNEYYELFVDYSMQQCLKNDYADKSKVKKHNYALAQLQKLKKTMCQNESLDIIELLLLHEDDRVRLNAAKFALEVQVCLPLAKATLNDIYINSLDSTLSFSAKLIINSDL